MQKMTQISRNIFLFWRKEFVALKGVPFFWGCFSSVLFLDGLFSFWIHVLYGTTDLFLFFSNMLFVVVVVTSILGGKLISEEKQNGTLALLLTKPISLKFFVVGKILFGCFFWGMIFLNSFLWNYFLSSSSGISCKFLAINYLGFLLLTVYLQTIAFVVSSICEGQFSSMMGSIFFFIFLYALSFLGSENLGVVVAFCKEISFVSHWDSFQRGVVDLGSIFYFVFWIIFGVFLSSKILQVRC